MNRRLTRSEKQYLILGILSVIIIILAFSILYFATVRQVEHKYKGKLQKAETQISNNKRMVYIANKNITAGEQLTSQNTTYTEVFSSTPSKYFINKDDIGKIAAVSINKKVHILKDMIVDEKIGSDIREEEYKLFTLNTNLKENDIVDIRIVYPNGENYIVLSKKSLKNLQLDQNLCYLWLSEDEILSLSSAVVDAYLHKGTKLYTSKYVQPSLQEESKITYIPNQSVMDLMKKDANILDIATLNLNQQARAELEHRLESFDTQNGENIENWSSTNGSTNDTSVKTEENTGDSNSTYNESSTYSNDGVNDEGDVDYVE
ncbi:hypothetical protein [Anaeromicropila herbilytica]|uniref:SAF domain-containing protein n=1 Tax=Anaeromicropila herbilytica TaxID=2785025 RepID=A0A7R7IE63_9FIRM|nr:hypothetical protein [Anaeromicropila herbilytica]BCN32418.1 hypothetical protein bsdtb5_37130 [Anaeromicropila herbilytica]